MYENNLFVNTLFEFLDYQPHIVSPPDGLRPEPATGPDHRVPQRQLHLSRPRSAGAALRQCQLHASSAGEAIALVGATARARRPSSSC